jgi:hypothetical protein
MKWLIIPLIVCSGPVHAQNKTFEQAALDYYTRVIHPVEATHKQKYVLADSVAHFYPRYAQVTCFREYYRVRNGGGERLLLHAGDTGVIVTSNFFPLCKKRGRGKDVIVAFRAQRSPLKTWYVGIGVFGKLYSKFYYIEFTPEKVPLRWCLERVDH